MRKDFKALKTYFDADDNRLNFIEPLLPIYVSQLNKSVNQLVEAHEKKDLDSCLSLTHKIRGSALTYGAKPIFSEISLIEDQLNSSENISTVDLNSLLESVKLLNKIYPIGDGT